MTVLKHVQRSNASLRLNKKPDSDSLPGFFYKFNLDNNTNARRAFEHCAERGENLYYF
jgi:hypothetical protein